MLNVLTPLSVSCVCLVYAVRLLSALFVSCVYLLRLYPASISCVYLVRLSHASISCVQPCASISFRLARLCSYYPLSNSSVPVVKRLSCSFRLCCCVLFILPPEQFKHSIHSIHSKRSTLITT